MHQFYKCNDVHKTEDISLDLKARNSKLSRYKGHTAGQVTKKTIIYAVNELKPFRFRNFFSNT